MLGVRVRVRARPRRKLAGPGSTAPPHAAGRGGVGGAQGHGLSSGREQALGSTFFQNLNVTSIQGDKQ